MKAIGRETVEREDLGFTAEGAESAERKGSRLTDEQREWLNKVFIPNFRAELMRTLRPEDLVGGNGRRGRGGRKGKAARHDDGRAASPTRLGAQDSPRRGNDREPASDEAATEALNMEAEQDVERTEGNDPMREGKTAAERQLAPSQQPGEEAVEPGAERAAEEAAERMAELEGEGSTSSPQGTEAEDESGGSRDMDRILELRSENARLRAILAETRVDRELVWAAAAQHAINPAQVAHLLKDRIRLDRNLDPMVVDANGDRAYDGYGRPVTLADAVRAFLEANPHLVRPSTQLAGGGSGGTDATVTARRVAAVTGGDLIEEALREGL